MNEETVQSCPECDASQIRPRRPGKPDSRSRVDAQWVCNDCGTRFDDPIERPSRGVFGTIPHSGLARELWDANADDVSRESAGL